MHSESIKVLKQRGIYEAAMDSGWSASFMTLSNTNYPGWKIPIWDYDGITQFSYYRWKNGLAAPPKGDKCRWLPKRPAETRYYILPDTIEQIGANGGLVFLASGEPDVMAYRAAGIKNVICWFDGENSVPKNLATDLQKMGVTKLIYYPDRDNAGKSSGDKVFNILRNEDIECDIRLLPFEHVDAGGGDINKLWIQHKFVPKDFIKALKDAPCIEYPTDEFMPTHDQQQELFSKRETATPDNGGGGNWWGKYIEMLKSKPELQPTKREGKIDRIRCVNPSHTDNIPSARISYDKDTEHGIYICNCQQSISWKDVGVWVNSPWEEYKKERQQELQRQRDKNKEQMAKAKEQKDAKSKTTPGKSDRELSTESKVAPGLLDFGVDYNSIQLEDILFSSDDAARLYQDRLMGIFVSKNRPTPFPFTAFHHLGGVFRVSTPGDLFGILGLSGGGKTSLLECIIDTTRQDAYNWLWISPEIPWWKTADRMSQRWGTMSVTESLLSDLYHSEMATTNESRYGVKPDAGKRDLAIQCIQHSVESWPGKLYSLDSFGADVNYFFAAIYKSVRELWHNEGIRITHLGLDYLQLMHAPPRWRGNMSYEEMLRMFKAINSTLSTVGYVTSQVRKSDATTAQEGGKIGANAGMNLRDFQFKGFITMRPGYKVDKYNNQVKADYSICNVTKNSEGITGEIELQVKWEQMLFMDHPAGGQRNNILIEPRPPEKKNGHRIV